MSNLHSVGRISPRIAINVTQHLQVTSLCNLKRHPRVNYDTCPETPSGVSNMPTRGHKCFDSP